MLTTAPGDPPGAVVRPGDARPRVEGVSGPLPEPVDLPPPDDGEERPAALGLVLEAGRGSLPFALVHGEPLVACAAWALGEAGVDLVDLGVGVGALAATGDPVVLHDALCPLTPPAFVVACLLEAVRDDVAVLGVRPVSDTVKRLEDADGVALLAETLDRDALLALASPLVLPARHVAELERRGVRLDDGVDLGAVARLLAGSGPGEVRLALAPPVGRRVHDVEDLRLLEALDPR